MTALTRGTGQTYLTALSDAAVDKDALTSKPMSIKYRPQKATAANVYPDETQPKFMNCELDMDSNLLTPNSTSRSALSFDATRVELRDAHATENKTGLSFYHPLDVSQGPYHLQVELGSGTCCDQVAAPSRTDSQFNLLWCEVGHGLGLRCWYHRRRQRNIAGTRQAMKVLPDVTPPDLKSSIWTWMRMPWC